MSGADRQHPVIQLLNDMETLRRLLRLYPEGHPALAPARERLAASAGALEAPAGVSLAFATGHVVWNGEELAVNPAYPSSRIVSLLFQLGIAAVRLTYPAAPAGIAALATLLAAVREPPGEGERQQLLSRGDDLAGVELVPLDLSRVQLVDETAVSSHDTTRFLWNELARRLHARGSFLLGGKLEGGQVNPGIIADLLASTPDQATLLDHVFSQLADVVRTSGEAVRPAAWREAKAFLDELLSLLDVDRRVLAIVAATRHLAPTAAALVKDEALVRAELLLDAVEHMLANQIDIPAVVQRAVYRLAAPTDDQPVEIPADIVRRSRAILPLLPLASPDAVLPGDEEAARATIAGTGAGAAGAAELLAALGESELHAHLLRTLGEAVSLWPRAPVGERAALRLADELVATIEIGDLAAAQRLAALVLATPSAQARSIATRAGAAATVRALRSGERHAGQAAVALLGTLGADALPTVIEALAEEESLAVRKRLIEAVVRHGEAAVSFLLPCLDDPRWYVVRNAIFMLRRLGCRAMLPQLKARLAAARPQVAAESLKALVAFQDPEWLRMVQAELAGTDDERLLAVMGVAARVRHPAVVRALSERLRERLSRRQRDDAVLVELISALGRLRDPAALPALQQVIELKQWRIPFPIGVLRREAAVSITMLEGPEARRYAGVLAGDRDADLAAAVRAALDRPAHAAEEAE